MDLGKIKRSCDIYDKCADVLFAYRSIYGFIVLDSDYNVYHLIINDADKTYYTMTSQGEVSPVRKLIENNHYFIATTKSGKKVRLDFDNEEIDNSFIYNNVAVSAGLVCFLITENDAFDKEGISKLLLGNLAIKNCTLYDYDGKKYPSYKLTEMGKEFVCASINSLDTERLKSIVETQGLDAKSLNEDMVIVKNVKVPKCIFADDIVFKAKYLNADEAQKVRGLFKNVLKDDEKCR